MKRPTFITLQKTLWQLGSHRILQAQESDQLARARDIGRTFLLFGVTLLAVGLIWSVLVLDWGNGSVKAPRPSEERLTPPVDSEPRAPREHSSRTTDSEEHANDTPPPSEIETPDKPHAPTAPSSWPTPPQGKTAPRDSEKKSEAVLRGDWR